MTERVLFHISEEPDIPVFKPRPSPSHFDMITGDVVFAIDPVLLHNYLLPRDCPRVTFYKGAQSTQEDITRFMGETAADFVMAVESGWLPVIERTTLYCYELPADTFTLLDECAGYYISYQAVMPLSVRPVNNILEELLTRNIELRFMPSLWKLAEAIKQSTLYFSIIRMRNAATPPPSRTQ